MFSAQIENFKKLNDLKPQIIEAVELINNTISKGNKILFCGNGGSASDSNHIAAEFVGRFVQERASIPAISLAANNSIITAVANDYSYNDIFKRQIEGLGSENDILIAISTSGKSKNILKAIKQANIQGLKVIFLTGENKMDIPCDIQINTPSKITAQIQEMHIALMHKICELLEL